MTHIYHHIIALVALLLMGAAGSASAQSWDFSAITEADQANLNADTDNWTYDSTNKRWKNTKAMTAAPVVANGTELALTQGLRVTVSGADRLRVDNKKHSLTLNGAGGQVTIPALKAGTVVTVVCQSSSSSAERGLTPTNLTVTDGFGKSAGKTTNRGTVEADGDVTLTADGGLYLYSITAGSGTPGGDSGQGGGGSATARHATRMDMDQNQAVLTTIDGTLAYYNTADVARMDIDQAGGTVTVSGKAGDWHDTFTKSVTGIDFMRLEWPHTGPTIDNRGVTLTDTRGWLEAAYVKWLPMEGAEGYRVYVRGGQYADFTAIDSELVRNYGSYLRADVPGLRAGYDYALRVVPVIGGTEDEDQASTAAHITVSPHDRSGFAHMNDSAVGAYNNDGTLKDGARVIYVSGRTAKTVTLDVVTGSKGQTETFTGLQAIVNAYQKGLETRPLAIRLIGTVRDTDMDYFGSKAEGLQIKGKSNDKAMNITIEGIGEDATIWGFGLLLRNAVSVELRNFAIMLCMDDAVSMDTDNRRCWVHHLDLFYGKTGGDSDQAKGDGTIDVKGNSQLITIAYNHFWDCGKTSLCGMKDESGPNYICYHHNWFDHSDSRHPRVRTMSVHVWNNYYDGCAKYGVGATMGASVFMEANFFRATKDPALISQQGTDAKGDGTFSGEDGGLIKSFGNVYAEKGASANYTPVTHRANATGFDCYEAATRDEEVPSSVKALVGGTTYNNFDTDPARLYPYSPLRAIDVPAAVTGWLGAGRLNKGDFKWTFDNATEDTNYGVIRELKEALQNYECGVLNDEWSPAAMKNDKF